MVADPNWGRTRMTWTGWDGSVWEITDPEQKTVVDVIGGVPQAPRPLIESGVFVVNEGVRGLSMPPFKRYTTVSPTLPGSVHRGNRTEERGIFWPLVIASDVSADLFTQRERAFFKTLDPNKTGTWTVIQPNGVSRSLVCRFVDDGDATYDRDPIFFGVATYGITMVAEQPYWQGQPITRLWSPGTGVSMFSGPGVITISPQHQFTTAEIDNPGDVEAWLTWTMTGPFTSGFVGVNDKNIEIPFALVAGERLVIESRPDKLQALKYPVGNGAAVDVTNLLGDGTEFGSVPARETATLTESFIDMTGTVTAEFVPQFYRAW